MVRVAGNPKVSSLNPGKCVGKINYRSPWLAIASHWGWNLEEKLLKKKNVWWSQCKTEGSINSYEYTEHHGRVMWELATFFRWMTDKRIFINMTWFVYSCQSLWTSIICIKTLYYIFSLNLYVSSTVSYFVGRKFGWTLKFSTYLRFFLV